MIKIEDYLSKSLRQSSVKSYLYDIEKYKKSNKNTDKYDYQKVMSRRSLTSGIGRDRVQFT